MSFVEPDKIIYTDSLF